MTVAVNSTEAAVSQLALLQRISAIVSSDMSLQKILDELIALVVGVVLYSPARRHLRSVLVGSADQ